MTAQRGEGNRPRPLGERRRNVAARGVRELKAVEALAASEGDSSVCGMIGDALADLGNLAEAGSYYDKVLEMD